MGRTRKSQVKGINNHFTTKACQSCITSVCFGIAKLWCLSLHKWVFLFSLLYALTCYAQKEIYAKKNKRKKNQNAFKYDCKLVSRRCESYRMYLENDSPHQAVMIVCECKWFSLVLNLHNMRHLCTLSMFSPTTQKLFATFDTCAGTIWFGHHKEYMY